MAEASPTAQYHPCVCCGELKARGNYDYCFRCKRKWEHVCNSCMSHGMPLEKAKEVATRYYPRRYRVLDNNTLAILADGSIIGVKVHDGP